MSDLTINRRGFIAGAAALFCAPSIVRASSLMPVRSLERLYPSLALEAAGKVFRIPYDGDLFADMARSLTKVPMQFLVDARFVASKEVRMKMILRMIQEHRLLFTVPPELVLKEQYSAMFRGLPVVVE